MTDTQSAKNAEPFGERLRRVRLAAGMTQESLARAAGVSVDAIGTLERGVRQTPRADTARLLADGLNLAGDDRERFLSEAAPHPRFRDTRHPAPTKWATTVGRGPPTRGRLPLPLTPLVGREALLDQVIGLVVGPGRLFTLAGPGGVGKTRVAQAVAGSVPDMVGWVDLATLNDPVSVPYVVAETVGLIPEPGSSPLEALCQWATKSSGLLVLDNCEHLLDAVADLTAGMLAPPGGVRVLTTSRERIDVPGEQVVVVPPLRLPAPGQHDADAEAVRLFVQRAAQAAPGLTLDSGLLDRVTEVCRALDGLPLAIELAAARVGTLTVDDLARRLDVRFELLRAQRGANPRHQTLRAVIDWSYDLLSVPERLVFARLSVFAADFDLAAAEVVAADERVPAPRIADLVALLADRSMLMRPGVSGVGRYRMLDTLRAYAASLLSPGELIEVRRAHARYIAEVAEQADAGLVGPDEAQWAARIEAWLDDARAAFAWARDAGEVDLAMRLVAALARYGYCRMRPDVLAWGDWAVENVQQHPDLPVAYAAAVGRAWLAGSLDEELTLARRAIEVAGGPAKLGTAVPLELASLCVFVAIRKVAQACWQVPEWTAATVVGGQRNDNIIEEHDNIIDVHDNIDEEHEQLLSALHAFAELTAPQSAARAVALAYEARALSYGNDPAAWPTAREAVSHARASGNPTAIATARHAEAIVCVTQDPVTALAALDEARAAATSVGCRLVSAFAVTLAVAVRGQHGSPDEALASFDEAIGLWRGIGNETLLGMLLSNLVVLFARVGRDAEAVELAATLQRAGPVRAYSAAAERIGSALTGAELRLGAQGFEAARAAGSKRTLDEAAERAQAVLAEEVATAGPPDRRVSPARH